MGTDARPAHHAPAALTPPAGTASGGSAPPMASSAASPLARAERGLSFFVQFAGAVVLVVSLIVGVVKVLERLGRLEGQMSIVVRYICQDRQRDFGCQAIERGEVVP